MSEPTTLWRVLIDFNDGDQRVYWHLDAHHSVRQYSAILRIMLDGPSGYARVRVFDDYGDLYHDTDTDPLNTRSTL